MNQKPGRTEAMQLIIDEAKTTFPLYEEETFVCGTEGNCIGCPKKLMELIDADLSYWENALKRGVIPQFDEIRRFGKLCKNVKRGLVRNHIL